MKKILFCVPLFFAGGFLSGVFAGETKPALTASAILKKSADTYAGFSSYQDEGVVLAEAGQSLRDEVNFKTYFTRPNLFCFEWTTHHPFAPLHQNTHDGVIWSDGKSGYHTDFLGTEKGTLTELVNRTMGVTKISSQHIPRLLSSKVPGFALSDLADVQLVGEERFEGVLCLHLSGTSPRGNYDLWIGKNDFLIHRIIRDLYGRMPVEEIRRGIRTNGKISTSVFDRPVFPH